MARAIKPAGLTRRSFLKTTGAVAAGAAIAGSATGGLRSLAYAGHEDEAADEQVFTVSCCGNCGGLDSLHCHVRDGKAFDITNCPLPERNRENICQRGMSNLYRIYGDRRILYPMRRTGERGSNEFERITWDEAIAEICEKWKGYQAEFGNDAVGFCGMSGSQRADSNGESGYHFRLFEYMGATRIHGAQDAIAMTSLTEMVGPGLTAWGNDWCTLSEADNVVCWGCNPTESAVVRFRHIYQAQQKGAKLTVIDPNFTLTANKADEYIPVTPATDGLVLIGMMRHILKNKLQHDDFLASMTVAPFLVKDSDGMYLRLSDLGRAEAGSDEDAPVVADGKGAFGSAADIAKPVITGIREADGHAVRTAYDLLVERVMGSEWTEEQISDYTGVGADKIAELAEMFASTKCTCVIAYGTNHYANGQTFYYNLIAMLMLTGNWGEPGRGVVGSDISFLFGAGPDVTELCNPADAPGLAHDIFTTEFFRLMEDGELGTEGEVPLKSLYITAANLVGGQPDRKRTIEALGKLDFIVVADIEQSDTTPYADILLPVCHWWESWGYLTSEGYIRVSEKALEPLGESKSDIDIVNLLMEGMGFGDKTLTTEEFFTKAFDNDTARAMGVSWESLKRDKIVSGVPEGFVPANGAGGFNTATGRAQFYREGCRPIPDFGQEWDYERERLPYWEPPREAWRDSEAAKKFPLQFTTERPKFKVHSMFSWCKNLLEILPEPVVYMNPADAEARNIESGDTVRTYNDRGYMVTKVALNPGTRPGMLVIDHGWQDGQFIDGHYQDLTGTHTGNSFSNACFNDTMVEVQKA